MSMANVCYKDALNEIRSGNGISKKELVAFLKSLDLYDEETIIYSISRLIDDGKIGVTPYQIPENTVYYPLGTMTDWLKNG